ncbi:hypothetical protein CLAIMM_13629 [Cladophialophora immunda]|nr:hypothetical protein CLAIMM_13629 [Cladophialophora immunda]
MDPRTQWQADFDRSMEFEEREWELKQEEWELKKWRLDMDRRKDDAERRFKNCVDLTDVAEGEEQQRDEGETESLATVKPATIPPLPTPQTSTSLTTERAAGKEATMPNSQQHRFAFKAYVPQKTRQAPKRKAQVPEVERRSPDTSPTRQDTRVGLFGTCALRQGDSVTYNGTDFLVLDKKTGLIKEG